MSCPHCKQHTPDEPHSSSCPLAETTASYKVKIEYDIYAESPLNAARTLLDWLTDGESMLPIVEIEGQTFDLHAMFTVEN